MKELTFNEIKLSDEVNFDFSIDEDKMNKFLEITGDANPLHNDVLFAKEKGYPEKVVYGMLSSSVFSTIAGMYMPGKNSLIHSVEIKFLKPVFISLCPLNVSAIVAEKDDRFKQITLKVTLTNKNSEKVLKGIMKIGVSE